MVLASYFTRVVCLGLNDSFVSVAARSLGKKVFRIVGAICRSQVLTLFLLTPTNSRKQFISLKIYIHLSTLGESLSLR